jgi:hypothetical protein
LSVTDLTRCALNDWQNKKIQTRMAGTCGKDGRKTNDEAGFRTSPKEEKVLVGHAECGIHRR